MKNQIIAYWHCKYCLGELPTDQSPRDYQRIQFGFTQNGIQVWCTRHNISIFYTEMVNSDDLNIQNQSVFIRHAKLLEDTVSKHGFNRLELEQRLLDIYKDILDLYEVAAIRMFRRKQK